MRHLLASAQIERLCRAIERPPLVAFDFDGTLAPIVSDRLSAHMRDRTRVLFEQVCESYPCAVISGRARDDVASRLGGAHVKYVIGNHGGEPHERAEQFATEIEDLAVHLHAALQGCDGVEIENKRYSLAIHYRGAADRPAARSAIEAAVAPYARRVRRVPGKLVLNIAPVQAPNKGDALLRLMAIAHTDVALYVGDDVTDEDVFRLDRPSMLLTARIGAAHFSAAQYYLRDQAEVDDLCAQLVALRRAAPH